MRNSRGKFTLDQLLEAKRAEKPSLDFWGEFNNELRIKQRRLLQQQPIETLGLETAFWERFRKIGALCAAAASCGAVGFVVMQSIGPAAISTTAYVEEPIQTRASIAQPSFVVEQSAPQMVATITPTISEFVEVAAIQPRIDQSLPVEQAPKALAVLASNRDLVTPTANTKGFTLAMHRSFDEMNIDASIQFNAEEKLTTTLMEKYIHPLSDRGIKYTQYVSNRADPLNRVSAMALKADLFNVGSRKDVKLNTLSLRF
jgi:hypothetical protein